MSERSERRQDIIKLLEHATEAAAEELGQLAQQVEQFTALLGNVRDAIVTASLEGHIASVNPAACRMFGYEERELIGKSLTTLMPERYRAAHSAGLSRFKSTGQSVLMEGQRIAGHGLHSTGREFPVEIILSSWQTSAGRFVSAVMRVGWGDKSVEPKS